MKTSQKLLVGVAIVAAFVIGIYVAKLFSSPSQIVGAVINGSTNSSAAIAEQSINAPATSTVFAIYNGDDNNRIINSFDIYLAPEVTATTSQYSLTCATSTVPYSNGNTNYIQTFSLLTYGTTSPTGGGFYIASSSPGVLTSGATTTASTYFVRVWPAGTYLVCTSGTTVGSNSNIWSASTGFIRFGISRQ